MIGSGIYEIRNEANGKRYIGSAISFKKRWARHLSALRCGHHKNQHLQRAYDRYGEETFSVSVLEYVADASQLILCEQRYLDMLSPEYNISPTAGSTLGRPCSLETRAKISAARMGQQPSAEARARMSAAGMGERNHNYGKCSPNFGKARSQEIRAKISRTLAGHPVSEETRAKLREAQRGKRNPFYGKHHTKNTKEKMSIAQKARWRRIHAAKNHEEEQ